jgi:hypothetical protein
VGELGDRGDPRPTSWLNLLSLAWERLKGNIISSSSCRGESNVVLDEDAVSLFHIGRVEVEIDVRGESEMDARLDVVCPDDSRLRLGAIMA